jgi:glycosyltransferase involved in cell wall biosynthesis
VTLLLPAARAKRPAVLFAHSSAVLYGADRVLLELLAGLQDSGHAVQVVLPGPGPLHEEVRRLGAPVHRHNLAVLRRKYLNPIGLANRACRMRSAVGYLRRLIREHGIEVVHSNTTAVFAGVIAARLAGVKHVWHVHEITTRPLWFARLLARCVGALSHRAVFVSQATLEHMCALSPRVRAKAVLIHNGIDDSRALAGQRGVLRAENGWGEYNPVVGMIGRINWWKGQDKLVECAVGLLKAHPGLRVVMVGGTFDGDSRPRDELVALIARHGLQHAIAVQDFRSDIGNVLADIDVFVLPSTQPDPFPTVVLEAMAAGKPVVGFRHGGVCEMVEDGVTGLLCEPCAAPAMQAAIERLVEAPEAARRMGQAGRARLDRLFTRQAFIDRFSRLYCELAAP